METYLGLDLGGTKLLIGEMDSRGNILRYKKYDSGYFNQQAALEIIKSSLDDYIRTVGWYDQKPVAMGVGLIGRVDPNEGVWLQIDPSRTQRIELAKELSDIYGMPCHIDNDVKSATRAERVWGFGQISKNFIGIKCGCGRMDCVEAIAAGIGFDNCARLLRNQYETSLHIPAEKGERVIVSEVFALSQKGDPLCTVLVENAAEALANLIMNLVRVIDPDTVVLGGGIVADGYMHEKILEKLHPTTMRFVSNGVVITKLNPGFIGLLGAGAVAMNM